MKRCFAIFLILILVLPAFADTEQKKQFGTNLGSGYSNSNQNDKSSGYYGFGLSFSSGLDTADTVFGRSITGVKNGENNLQSITIDEVRAVISLPSQMKWATREKGDIDFVAANYHQTTSNLPSYMAQNDYYLMAVDPDSDLRVSLLVYTANISEKNSVNRSDEDLLSDLEGTQFDVFSSVDKWVWRNDTIAFSCLITKINEGQLIALAMTTINGRIYTIMIRDTDEERVRTAFDVILSHFTVTSQDVYETMQIEICEASLELPVNWKIVSRSMEEQADLGITESIILEASAGDGSRRVIMITLVDFAQTLLGTIDADQRAIFDQFYGPTMIKNLLSSQGVSVIKTVRCGETDLSVFRQTDDLSIAVMAGIAKGYMVRVEWGSNNGDVLVDDWFPELQVFVTGLIECLR